VLCPGRFDRGEYALVDLHNLSVEFAHTAAGMNELTAGPERRNGKGTEQKGGGEYAADLKGEERPDRR
jgi:hypothetical protein